MEKLSLFDIGGEYLRLYEIMTDPDADPQAVEDTLESLDHDLEEKAGCYVAVIKRFEMERDAAKEQSKAFADAAARREKAIKRMKERMLTVMDMAGIKKIPTPDGYVLKAVGNGGVKPLVIDRPEEVPDSMKVVKYENDNAKIRAFLKDHKCGWAHLGERGRRLDIKVI